MNDLSIVSHIKNEIDFLEQFWKHIHVYEPREIIIVDTGSIDGTYEKLLEFERDERIAYRIEQIPHYTGQVYMFNKVIEMATSTWVMKIDADELYKYETVSTILDIIEDSDYNCIDIPTIHHFINSDLFFNVLDDVPDFHQRVFKKDVFKINAEVGSKNHGSIMWSQPLNMLTFGRDDSMFHYTMLRPFKSLQKRSIINYYIDIEKINDAEFMKTVELNTDEFINFFSEDNTGVVPAWQIVHSPIPFNTLVDYFAKEFVRIGKQVDFQKPQDLIVNKIATWPNEEEILKNIQ